MKGWTLTRVWRVGHKLVVAPTSEEAIALFKTYMGKDYRDEPDSLVAIFADTLPRDFQAIIKEEKE